MTLIVNQDARCPLAGTKAFGKFQRRLTVGRRLARLNAETRAEFFEQLFSSAEHARDAAANPDSLLPERCRLVAEEAVKAQRVVDFGGVQLEQLGDFPQRRGRNVSMFF